CPQGVAEGVIDIRPQSTISWQAISCHHRSDQPGLNQYLLIVDIAAQPECALLSRSPYREEQASIEEITFRYFYTLQRLLGLAQYNSSSILFQLQLPYILSRKDLDLLIEGEDGHHQPGFRWYVIGNRRRGGFNGVQGRPANF